MAIHKPVLSQEVLHFLEPKPNQHFIDATLGEGGHAKAILEKTGPGGILLGIDRDIQQIERAKKELLEFGERVIYVKDSFGHLLEIVRERGEGLAWQGILFDLGWSHAQLEKSGRGFSFERDEPLDMRYTTKLKVKSEKFKVLSAKDIVNKWRQEKIENILREYGEERFAGRIAHGIVKTRTYKAIQTTFQLVNIIKEATPLWYHHRRIHPATKTFQALRIAVNDEYTELERGLRASVEVVAHRGRIAVISFHSGEARIVKKCYLEFESTGYGIILTKKPIRSSHEQVLKSPQARSAQLRVFQAT